MIREEVGSLRWSCVMSVGVPALDIDHQCLIRIISLLHGIKDAQKTRTIIESVLDTMSVYSGFHFKREERIIRAFALSQVEAHQDEHRAFVWFVDTLRNQYAGCTETGLARHLFKALAAWIGQHIQVQNRKFKLLIDDAERAEQIARTGTATCLVNIRHPRPLVRVRHAPRPAAFSAMNWNSA